MNEGYQDREDPGLTVRFPLVDRPGECAPRLDDDALDARPRTWPRRSGPDLRYVRVRQGEDRFWVGKGTLKAALSRARSRCSRRRPGRRPRRLALHGPVRRAAGGPRRRSREAGLRAPRRRLGRGRRGRGHGHRPHRARLRRRGLPAGQGARPAGHRRRSTRTAATSPGFGWLSRPRRPGGRRADRGRPRAARVLLPPRAVQPPLPALLAVRDAAAVPPRRRVVHLDGPGLRHAARAADHGSRSTRASATRSWRSSTGSGGSRASATTGSSTGSATCATG